MRFSNRKRLFQVFFGTVSNNQQLLFLSVLLHILMDFGIEKKLKKYLKYLKKNSEKFHFEFRGHFEF
jgi:hypothetical protein